MRKMALILLALLMLSGCGKTENPENPYRIKTQILESYQEEDTQTITTEYRYNEQGYLTQLQTFNGSALWYTRQFSLDAQGNSLGSEVQYADGTRTGEKGITFDDQGRMLTSESYQNDQVTATTEYGYSKAGQVIKLYINRIDALGADDLKSYVDSTYDQKGNLLRQDIRWEPTGQKEYTLYFYEKGRLLKTESYAEEALNYYSEYTYDETGLVQTAIERSADGTLQSKHITTFDEFGNPLEIIAYAYGSELARFGRIDEEPDSRTVNIYEPKEGTS